MSTSAPAPENHYDVGSTTQFQELLSADLERISVIYFWAPWAEPCKQTDPVVLELARKHPKLLALRVEAEEQADIADSFDVESVPTFVVLRVRRLVSACIRSLIHAQGHTLLGRITGADAAALTALLDTHLSPRAAGPLSSTTQAPAPLSEQETPAQLETRLKDIMARERVMLFMKGDPDTPRCGFSRKAVALLRDQNVHFGSFDILEDEVVRSGASGRSFVCAWPLSVSRIQDSRS
jgi:thiol-disulfide isomerase/thioredoxin